MVKNPGTFGEAILDRFAPPEREFMFREVNERSLTGIAASSYPGATGTDGLLEAAGQHTKL